MEYGIQMYSLRDITGQDLDGALGAVAAGIIFIVRGDGMYGLALLFAGVLLAGLTIFLCYGCIGATKGAAILTKKIALKIKSLFLRKEDAR